MDVTSYLLGKQAGGGGGQPSLQNKSVTITENGTQNVTADAGYDGLGNVGITTNVQPVLEAKSVTITENTTTTITPTTGKDGLSSVEVTTNVSGGGGLDWSAIGYSGTPQSITTDYNYSKNIYDNWDNTQTDLSNKFANDTSLVYMPLVDTSNATNMFQMFNSCNRLVEMPLIDTSKATDIRYMFSSCNSLKTIPQINTSSATNIQSLFSGCSLLENVPILNTANLKLSTSMQNVFSNCTHLTDTSLDNILQMCINATIYTGTKTLYRLGITNSTIYPASKIQALPHYQDFLNAGWTIGY